MRFFQCLIWVSLCLPARSFDFSFDHQGIGQASDALNKVDYSNRRSDRSTAVINPWDDDDDEEMSLQDKIFGTLNASGCSLYGFALLLFSTFFPGQIHLLTMMRATGYDKLQFMVRTLKRNIRDAILRVLWESPDFVGAALAMRNVKSHIEDAKGILRANRQARADGKVTPREALELKLRKKREIAQYKKDLRRIVQAGSSLGKVWKALDVDEIMDVGRSFLFQMMCVMASGHNKSILGSVISRWCLFWNLGTLILDTNAKLGYPIAKLVLRRSIKRLENENAAALVERTGEFILFSSAGYLTMFHNVAARHLNAAYISSSIIYRGLRDVVGIFWDREEDGLITQSSWNHGIWSVLGKMLEGWTGGVFMLSLVVLGVYRRMAQEAAGEEDSQIRRLKQVNATNATTAQIGKMVLDLEGDTMSPNEDILKDASLGNATRVDRQRSQWFLWPLRQMELTLHEMVALIDRIV